MIDTIRSIIQKEESVLQWVLTETHENSIEGFFVGTKQEQIRRKNTLEYTLFLLCGTDDSELMGFGNTAFGPELTEKEIEANIRKAVDTAKYVQNPGFTLEDSGVRESRCLTSGELAQLYKDAVSEILSNCEEDVLSSFEVFSNERSVRKLSSAGTDISETCVTGWAEIITHFKAGQNPEVELYGAMSFSGLLQGRLKDMVEKQVSQTKDRAEAGFLKDLGNVPVVLSVPAISDLMDFYRSQVDALQVYEKLSSAQIGKPLIEIAEESDGINITLKPNLYGSPECFSFDKYGSVRRESVLIEDGQVKNIAGDAQYGSYIGLETITGDSKNILVAAGSLGTDFPYPNEYLEVSAFSDFRIDPITGNFGGELRLSYFCSNGKRTPFTSGSITGNAKNLPSGMRLSSRTIQFENYLGPDKLLIYDVSINPAK